MCGRSARRLAKPSNSFADPSSPGLMKSKMDHRSPSRFSTGVPVSANLASRLELLDGPGLLGVRILDGLRFVEHDQVPCGFRHPRHAQQRAVAGDDQVHIPQPFRRKVL